MLTAEAVGSSFPILDELLNNPQDLITIYGDFKAIEAAPDASSRYDAALKAAADAKPIVLAIEATFSGGSPTDAGQPVQAECSEGHIARLNAKLEAAHEPLKANGVIIGELIQALPQIASFITGMITLFKGKTAAS